MAKDEQLFKDLEKELRSHDWYYHYSDDHSVWSRGRAQWQKISALLKKAQEVDRARADALYKKYSKR